MRAILFTFFVLSGFLVISQNKISDQTQQIKWLKDFYSGYMKGSVQKKDYLEPQLISKLDKIGAMIGADPITSSQDVIPEMIETLQVTPIKNQWYKVTYHTKSGKKKQPTNIFVHIRNSKIASVYPWSIDIDAVDTPFKPEPISNKDNVSFVKTFYLNYLNCYIGDLQNVDVCLSNMSNKYCTKNLLKKINKTKEEYKQDGQEGFDPLIDDFYFDKSFIKSLKFKSMGQYKVLLEYKNAFGKEVKMYLHLIRTKQDGFRIDDISEK